MTAQLRLGFAYMSGSDPSNPIAAQYGVAGIPLDKEQSYVWLNKAANQQCIRAQWMLACNYSTGDEVLHADFARELYWLNRIVVQADKETMLIAVRQHNTVRDINENKVTIAQVDELSALRKALSQDQQIVVLAIGMLDHIIDGKSPYGDRPLTPEELQIRDSQ
jgi:hypothetical protein